MNLKKLKAFTLVEVLIVIIIVGILIAALLPRLTGSQQTARNTARTAAVNQLANGIALFVSQEGAIQAADDNKVICVDAGADITDGSVDLASVMSSIPTDPQANRDNGIFGVACTTGFPVVVADGGNVVMVASLLEGEGNGNASGDVNADDAVDATDLAVLTDGDTDTDPLTLTELQTLIGLGAVNASAAASVQDQYFAAIVQG